MFFNNVRHVFRQFRGSLAKMTSIDRIRSNAESAKQTIEVLKSEMSVLNNEYNKILAKELREENAKLVVAIEDAKKRLIDLEVRNGIQQIPVPNQKVSIKTEESAPPTQKIEVKEEVKVVKTPKVKKEKAKDKEPQIELPVDIGRLDLRIAKVEDVQRHPDADSLYVLTINCGEEKPRTVCSGLVKHIPLEELKDRIVLLLCNLKPVKMRGITSEAMVMCASSEKVEVLLPPQNSVPGDLVQCEGYTRQPDLVMNPKKKIFETVAPDLHTDSQQRACYKGIPLLVPEKGAIVSQTLSNVPVK